MSSEIPSTSGSAAPPVAAPNLAHPDDPYTHVKVDDEYVGFYVSPPYPAGVRFAPTDQELIEHYLAVKVLDAQPLPCNLITDAELYSIHPSDLVKSKPCVEGKCYIFTSRERRYGNGQRPRRDAAAGHWKAIVADTGILDSDGATIGFKKTLVYYEHITVTVGGVEKKINKKTNWKMQEFRVQASHVPPNPNSEDMLLDSHVLCRIYFKSERNRDPEDDDENESRDSSKQKRENKSRKRGRVISDSDGNQDVAAV